MKRGRMNWATILDKLALDSGGQSGDPQGLSDVADASDLSVQELAETDQALEAEIVEGVEDAADHPERPCIHMWSMEVRRRSRLQTTGKKTRPNIGIRCFIGKPDGSRPSGSFTAA